jgi:hypothetical protein
MGYHKAKIDKGKFGEISKIQEELDELKDSMDQQVVIMALVELADIYGAMEGFLDRYFPSITMEDVKKMSELTKHAFQTGDRV